MALKYKLERGPKNSMYVHLRDNPPVFQDRISKERYDTIPLGDKKKFLTSIFNTGGVIEAATQSYLVWIMKAPTFEWKEMLPNILYEISMAMGEKGEVEAIEGSADLEGKGGAKLQKSPRKLVQGLTIETPKGLIKKQR